MSSAENKPANIPVSNVMKKRQMLQVELTLEEMLLFKSVAFKYNLTLTEIARKFILLLAANNENAKFVIDEILSEKKKKKEATLKYKNIIKPNELTEDNIYDIIDRKDS